MLERNVLHFQRRAEAQMEEAAGHGHGHGAAAAALLPEATGLHEAVSLSVGCEHWTTRLLAGIVSDLT